MEIQNCLKNVKLLSALQVDISYFNNVASQVFKDPKQYSVLVSDVQFINQIGLTLFNYFGQQDPNSQRLWYQSLVNGLTQSIKDAEGLVSNIPADSEQGNLVKTILDTFINDCKVLESIIPTA